MIDVNYDAVHNVIMIAYKGDVDVDQTRKAITELETVLPTDTSGLRCLIDLSSVGVVEPEVQDEIKRMMEIASKLGITDIFRVFPDPNMDFGFEIMERERFPKQVKFHTFRSRDEALALLKQDNKS